MVLCLAVAMLSSMPWLIKPDLQPGSLAPFDSFAPKDAVVQDSTVLEQRRSSLVARSVVQVIDRESTDQLRQRLKQQLQQIRQLAESGSAARIGPVNLTTEEKQWLEKREEQANERISVLAAAGRKAGS